MDEIIIKCDAESPQSKNTPISISVENNTEHNLKYKYIVGSDGKWNNIKDFSEDTVAVWQPSEDGRYIIMVQAKRECSTKPFEFMKRMEYIIGRVQNKLINNIFLENENLTVGEKLSVTVESNVKPLMFRFWIKDEDNWQLVKDYSAENNLKWAVKNSGRQELMVECKSLDSPNKYDDYGVIAFQVKENAKVEIKNIKCISNEFLVGKELDFQVEALHDDSRLILYKFLKIDSSGKALCVQDYSTKRLVSYTEKESGEYKLLCLAKDMYSQNEYDDRALISYSIKVYNPVEIQGLTTDLTSPQLCDTEIVVKALVSGGKNLIYRFIIDGNQGDDSGFIRNSTYAWKTGKAGKYKIMLWVKDTSFEGNYEATETIDFTVDEVCDEPVTIEKVLADREPEVLKGQVINVKAIASGGNDLKYNFIVTKDGNEIERTDFGSCNWVNFTPENKGEYELEVRVKDKYSKRDYDVHQSIFFKVHNFIPAAIDYILMPIKENYIAGENIAMNVITRNTKEVLLKYSLSINGQKVEETGFVENKKYSFIPNYPGNYLVETFAKSKESDNEYDDKKETLIQVKTALPVNNVKITCDTLKITCNSPVNFTVHVDGGKDVMYEFYLFEKNDWKLVQSYSRKKYFSFIPFVTGNFKLLALCKSQFSNGVYEDYDVFEFNAEA